MACSFGFFSVSALTSNDESLFFRVFGEHSAMRGKALCADINLLAIFLR
jgi:hypothetical protein